MLGKRALNSACVLAAVASIVAGDIVVAQAPPAPVSQSLPEEELDPASPLAAMPGIGVDWPDLNAPMQEDVDVPVAEPAPSASLAKKQRGRADRAKPYKPDAKSSKAEVKPSKDDDGLDDAVAERRYRVSIEGLTGEGRLPGDQAAAIEARFDLFSVLRTHGRARANVAQINRRAHEDEGLLLDLLRGAGYYDAAIITRTERAADDSLNVVMGVEPGSRYLFSSVTLDGIDAAGDQADVLRAAFGVVAGDPIDTDRVVAGTAALRTELGRRGFAFASVSEPQVTVDHDSRQGEMVIAVRPGALRRIGELRLEGDTLFSARHLARIARFKTGDIYDAVLVEDLRRALVQTGLISIVTIKAVPGLDPAIVDMVVKLEKAPPRTVSGSFGYGTGEGFRIEASWQHRNLIKPEGAVTFRGVLGTEEQVASASFRRSNFRSRDQALTAQVAISNLQQNAYKARSLTLAAAIERQTNIIWQKDWTWSYGGELILSDEEDTVKATGLPRRRRFVIGALPTTLAYDDSDDLLNPAKGYRITAKLSPEASFQGSAFGYVKSQIDASIYWPVLSRVVLAGRSRFGTIFGADAERIAPTRRFYAGGGGSVRGYSYQRIGPVDVDDAPTGGRSLIEFAAEARIRLGDFGIVPFIDAGNLYAARIPDFSGLRYGAGLGVRYYTNFGPIRLDVGTPINRRPGESRIAIYVSLGQAF